MKVHFIAIGGSAMHNMAIALHKKGIHVTGSDDEILEPSKSRLEKHGLLPRKIGWYPENITPDIDAIVLGMQARIDNPELIKAQELGIRVYSYPEYIYEQSKNKKRVVIGGSHGKTSITAMILHVLSKSSIDFDYMVGAQLTGFDTMVKITDAPLIILEGDEYLSSPIDRRPKFHLYNAHIGLISGIAWDHINVFPTFKSYVEQFEKFMDTIEENGTIIYCASDENVKNVVEKFNEKKIKKIPYTTHLNRTEKGITYLTTTAKEYPLLIFGNHNLQNLNGAKLVCNELGISDEQFYSAIISFKGAAKRLELIAKTETCSVLKDFAHSPSKLKATTEAVKNQFPDRKLIACMELHTFSSLNANFLEEYAGSMDFADEAIVYFNPHTLQHKKLPEITENQVKNAFKNQTIQVFNDSKVIVDKLKNMNWNNANLLLMSSGNFDGVNLDELGSTICNCITTER